MKTTLLPRMYRPSTQRGVSLIIILILSIAAVLLGTSAAVIALQSEKASRGDRDRQLAFQTAEAALIDAQRDVDTAPGPGINKRLFAFSADSVMGFPPPDDATTCSSDRGNLGLCKGRLGGKPSWLRINLVTDESASVPYGYFTGQVIPVGRGALPSALPRYVIELMSYNQPGAEAAPSSAYRITAIGFGANRDTHVILQSFYRKAE